MKNDKLVEALIRMLADKDKRIEKLLKILEDLQRKYRKDHYA